MTVGGAARPGAGPAYCWGLDERLWLAALVVVGFVLRIYALGAQSLWADEGLSYAVASAPDLGEVIERAAHRSMHPPLGFLLNHFGLQLGGSDAMMRLPSALLGTLTIPLVFYLARLLTWPAAALLATGVFALSPFHLWHSQDARAYAPLLLASVASTLFLLWTLRSRRWGVGAAGYAVTAALTLHLHAFGALQVMAHGLWLLVCRWRLVPWFALAVAGASLLAAPVVADWAGRVTHRVTQVGESNRVTAADRRPRQALAAVPYVVYAFAVGYSFGPGVDDLQRDRSMAALKPFLPAILLVGALYGTLLVIGAWVAVRRLGAPGALLIGIGLVVPLALALILSVLTRFPFNVRYGIAAYPYFCILLGLALAWLGGRLAALGWCAALAVTGISAWSWANQLGDPRYAKADLRSAVAVWQGADDELFGVTTAGGVHDTVRRYLSEAERKRYVPIGRTDVAARIEQALRASDRRSAHVIVARDWDGRLEDELEQHFEVLGRQEFPGVHLLEIAPAAADDR